MLSMTSPQPTNSPMKKSNSATKLKGGNGKNSARQGEDFDGIVDINEIKLLEEA